MQTADFDFDLPPNLIAQTPTAQRDQSRLLVLHRQSGKIEHRLFGDFADYLAPDDVLVLNDSRVIPARLHGTNASSAGQFELLLLEEVALNDWWVMLRPGKRGRLGTRILLRDASGRPTQIEATVIATNEEGHRRIQFSGTTNILDALDSIGEAPLPPYIMRNGVIQTQQDRERYQTVFAKTAGSVAAPTAGLHFTETLLDQIRARGVHTCFLTLHVGVGTFAPVKAETVAAHLMHEERYELSAESAELINEAKRNGRRVFAVGTTTVRVLETVAKRTPGPEASPLALSGGSGRTRIFIYPPSEFRVVDCLLTNFHLPRSTLLMLASAFAAPGETRGRALMLSTYTEAIRQRYRFFSYGDAMLLL